MPPEVPARWRVEQVLWLELVQLVSHFSPKVINIQLNKITMSAQKPIKPAKLKMGDKEKPTLPNAGGKEINPVPEHDYAMDVTLFNKRERGAESVPTTPNKKPAEKKSKSADDGENVDVSSNVKAILDAIMNLGRRFDDFEKKVDTQLADLREQIKQSSAMIVSLSKAVQFNAEEVKECKKKSKIWRNK